MSCFLQVYFYFAEIVCAKIIWLSFLFDTFLGPFFSRVNCEVPLFGWGRNLIPLATFSCVNSLGGTAAYDLEQVVVRLYIKKKKTSRVALMRHENIIHNQLQLFSYDYTAIWNPHNLISSTKFQHLNSGLRIRPLSWLRPSYLFHGPFLFLASGMTFCGISVSYTTHPPKLEKPYYMNRYSWDYTCESLFCQLEFLTSATSGWAWRDEESCVAIYPIAIQGGSSSTVMYIIRGKYDGAVVNLCNCLLIIIIIIIESSRGSFAKPELWLHMHSTGLYLLIWPGTSGATQVCEKFASYG